MRLHRVAVLAMLVTIIACGDAVQSNNSNGTTNNVDPNGTPNGTPNNVTTPSNVSSNNQNVMPNGTTGPGSCTYIAGDVDARSDADLDPLRNTRCTEIEGSLFISGDVSDLQNLNIEEIGGDLRISGSRASETPFPALRRIDGSLIIEGNPAISSLDGFDELESVGGKLIVAGGPVTEIMGFASLRRAGGLLLSDLPFATDFSGLSRLTAESVAIYDVPMLESLDDFQSMVTTRSLQLYRNDSLNSVAAFSGVNLDRLELALNPALTTAPLQFVDSGPVEARVAQNDTLAEFSTQRAIEIRTVWVLENPAMETVELPDAESSIDEIRVENQPTTTVRMPNLADFDNVSLLSLDVTSVTELGLVSGGQLSLNNLDSLQNLAGLETLDTVRGFLSVRNSSGLTTIRELQGMSRIGTLRVQNNPNVPECEVLLVSTTAGTIGTVESSGNGAGLCP